MLLRASIALIAAVLLHAPPAGAEVVAAFNSYLRPPFLDAESQTGLAPDLVAYLNRKLSGAYQLKLENVPRARLSKLVLNRQGNKFAGVALFLTPRFVADNEQTRFLWSRPISSDYNSLIFRNPAPRTINDLQALAGLRFAGVYEYHYQGIDAMSMAGQIHREDAADEQLNLAKLLAGRVDFTLMNHSYFVALAQANGYEGRVTAMAVPGEAPFNRYILIGRQNKPLKLALDKVIAGMASDPEWRLIVSRYALSRPL